MTERRKIGDDEILGVICEEIFKEDWLPSVVAAAASKLEIAASTITRRFGGTADGLRDALICWILDSDGQPQNDWPDAMAAGMIGHMEARESVVAALEAAAEFNWRLIEADDRMFLQMLLWSRIRDDLRLRSKMQAHYAGYDRVHRNIWQDMLSHLRERTGKPVLQRPGLTEQELVVVFDAMVEGFVLRSKADPSLHIAEIYVGAMQALIAGVLDFDADLNSIAAHLAIIAGDPISGT